MQFSPVWILPSRRRMTSWGLANTYRAWSSDGPRVSQAGLDFLHTAPAPSLGGRGSILVGCRRVSYASLVQHDLDRPMVDPARVSDSSGLGVKGIKQHDTGIRGRVSIHEGVGDVGQA